MDFMQISKKDFQKFVENLIQSKEEVVGVVKKGKHFAYDILEKSEQLCLDYTETILPPKKYFLPVEETLLKYKTGVASSYEATYGKSPKVIIGIHPGDMAAIALLDKSFSEGEKDSHYLNKRANSTLIGIYPTQSFPHRFSNSMIEKDAYKAADCFLVDLGNDYGIEVVTEKGKKIASAMKAVAGEKGLNEKIAQAKAKIKDEVSMPFSRRELSEFLHNKETHAEWKKRAEKCFSCGSCVLVCPTCYCFDVKDTVALSLQEGERKRMWDGCMLEKFANVAGNHNFRKLAGDRLKHRIFRKGKYIIDKFGMAGCVGCGRCSQACVANIASPVDIVQELKK
ncbi:MAG: 4Fe-4S dicluster domain-containing protein [Candidatus Brocadiae bacterium]|nr:4Fe-4S dicluster domain-containing protein [Candidatus Brocadiia bacterium]